MENDRNEKDENSTFDMWFGGAFLIIASIILTIQDLKPEGFQGIETIIYFILGTVIISIFLYVIAMIPTALIYVISKVCPLTQFFMWIAIFLSVFSLAYYNNPTKYQFVTREKYDAVVKDYQIASDEAYHLDKELESYVNNTPSLYRDLELCQNEALAMYEFLKSKGYTAEDVPLDTEFLGMLEMLEKDN